MYHLCLSGILGQISGYPVIKSHTDSNQYVTFIGQHIWGIVAMHTQHPHIQGMVMIKR